MSSNEFVLPDVGEGLTEAEIVSWAVKAGDTVHLNQVICEIETEKSLVEIPSPFEGEIAELLVEPGTTVPVGTPILRMVGEVVGDGGADGGGADGAAGAAAGERDAGEGSGSGSAAAPGVADTAADPDAENPGAVLVGYGTGGPLKSRRRPGGQQPIVAPLSTAADAPPEPGKAYVKPPVRKLARDLGIALEDLA